MPDQEITLTEADQRLLDRLGTRLGFKSRQQVAEWLVKRRLARVARQANGRGRALYMLPRPGRQGGR